MRWKDTHAQGSLRELHTYVTRSHQDALDWYRDRKAAKKDWSLNSRVLALVAVGLSGLIPIVSGLGPLPEISPLWSTALLALSGFIVMFDRLYGHTKGWIRYMRTMQQIERQLVQYCFDWESLKLLPATVGPPAPPEQVNTATPYLKLAQDAIKNLQSVIAVETQEWAAEFSSAIQDLDTATKGKGKDDGSATAL